MTSTSQALRMTSDLFFPHFILFVLLFYSIGPLEQAKPAVDKLREFASGGTKSAAEVDAEILRVQKEFTLDEEKRAMIISEALFAESLYAGDLTAFVKLVNQYKPVLVKVWTIIIIIIILFFHCSSFLSIFNKGG